VYSRYGHGVSCMAQVPRVVHKCPTQSESHRGQSGGEVYWKRISNPLSQEFEGLRVRGLKTGRIRGQQTVGMSRSGSVQLKPAVE
jgi:hypothetical protein